MKIYFLILLFFINLNSTDKNYEVMELSYNSFVQTKDLENAYKIAKKMVDMHPNDIKWLNNLAKVCLWIGRIDEAIDLYEKIFNLTKNVDYVDDIIRYIKIKKPELYEKILLTKIDKKFDENSFKQLIDFYTDLLDYDRISSLVKKYENKITNKDLFENIAYVYIDIDTDKAIYYFNKSNKNNSCEFYFKLSKRYLYTKNYSKLEDIVYKNKNCLKNYDFNLMSQEFFILKGDYNNLRQASLELFENSDYREIDAERLYMFYIYENKSKAKDIALKAYNKFKKSYFLYFYINSIDDSLEDKNEIKRLISKEFDENFVYIYLLNYKNLTEKQKYYMYNYSLKTKDNNFISNYLWTINSYGEKKEKERLLDYYKCSYIDNNDILISLGFLNLSIYRVEDAYYCFYKSKILLDLTPSFYLNYSDFLRIRGFETESMFFKRKAFDMLAKKDSLTDSEKIDYFRAAIDYINSEYYLEKLKKDFNKDTLEFLLSYYSKYNYYEKIRDLLKSKDIVWAKFLILNYDKNFDEIYKLSQRNYIAPRDIINIYEIKRLRDLALEDSFSLIKNAPYDYKNQIVFRNAIENNSSNSYISLSYKNRDYAEENYYDFGFKKYLYRNMFLNFNINYEKNIFLKKPDYKYHSKDFNSLSLGSYSNLIDLELTRHSRIKDFYSFSIQKNFNFKYFDFKANLAYKEISYDNFLLEMAGYENSFKNTIVYKQNNKSYIDYTFNFKEYYDQKNTYLGNGFLNEIGLFSKNRFFSYRFFTKNASFKKAPYSNNLMYTLYYYNPAKIIPDNFNEYGLTLFLFQDDLLYSNYYSFPLNVTFFYNSKTDFNYAFDLNLKSKAFHKKDFVFNLSYAKSGSTNKDSIFLSKFIMKFR